MGNCKLIVDYLIFVLIIEQLIRVVNLIFFGDLATVKLPPPGISGVQKLVTPGDGNW